jgi:hypothetical protein
MYVHIGWSFEHKLNVGRCEGTQGRRMSGVLRKRKEVRVSGREKREIIFMCSISHTSSSSYSTYLPPKSSSTASSSVRPFIFRPSSLSFSKLLEIFLNNEMKKTVLFRSVSNNDDVVHVLDKYPQHKLYIF